MANFPQWIYQLTKRDQQVTPLEVVTITGSNAAAASNISVQLYTVPKGKILLLDSVSFFENPFASQKFVTGWFSVIGQNGSTILGGVSAIGLPASTLYINSVQMNGAIIAEGNIITCTNVFDTGSGSNSATNGLSGVLIPRGNFAI